VASFAKPKRAGACGRNQFTMIRAADTVFSLMQLFSLGRPSACVLDHEDMISWVVRSVLIALYSSLGVTNTEHSHQRSQSSFIAFLHEYTLRPGVQLGSLLPVEMNMIISTYLFLNNPTLRTTENFLKYSSVPWIKQSTRSGEAFVSLCIHQVSLLVPLDRFHLLSGVSVP
jgi:hypothetical protein